MLIAAFTEVTGRAAFGLVGSVNCHFGHVNFGETSCEGCLPKSAPSSAYASLSESRQAFR